jgi:hypothetical protein
MYKIFQCQNCGYPFTGNINQEEVPECPCGNDSWLIFTYPGNPPIQDIEVHPRTLKLPKRLAE